MMEMSSPAELVIPYRRASSGACCTRDRDMAASASATLPTKERPRGRSGSPVAGRITKRRAKSAAAPGSGSFRKPPWTKLSPGQQRGLAELLSGVRLPL